MNNTITGTYINKSTGENINFNFYTNLSMSDKLSFVQSVTDILVDDGNYNFILKDLVMDFFVVEMFTDIDTEIISESNFVYNAETFLKETNVVDIVKANMEVGLYEELNKAVDLDIEYKTGIHKNILNEALASLVATLKNKIKDFDTNKVMEMANAFSSITDDFTTENIVKAYLETDVAKNNKNEVDTVKNKKYNKKTNVVNIDNKK